MLHLKLVVISVVLILVACKPSNKNSSAVYFDNSDSTKGFSTTFNSFEFPRNIIFLIGDGMGLAQITAGLISKDKPLSLERCRSIGLVKTNSTKLITDSAASATAMATGHKTYNGAISMDVHQKN